MYTYIYNNTYIHIQQCKYTTFIYRRYYQRVATDYPLAQREAMDQERTVVEVTLMSDRLAMVWVWEVWV